MTLYQLLSSRLPFPGTNATDIAISVATEPPQPLDVPAALHAVIWKCLEKAPADRYANLGELMVALAPFGGPTARQHLALAAALGAPVTPPSMQVVTPITQPTQSTQSTGLGRIPPTKSTGVIVIPRKRRSLLLVALVMFVGVGGAAGWIVLGKGSQPTAVAPVTIDATIVATVPRVAIDAAAAEIDAPTPIDAGPVDAGTKPSKGRHAKSDVWQQINAFNEMFEDPKKLAQMCKGLAAPAAAAMVPSGMSMRCACVRKDVEAASRLINVFPKDQQPEIRAQCKTYGVTIP